MDDPVLSIVAHLRETSRACKDAANDLSNGHSGALAGMDGQPSTNATAFDDSRLAPVAAGILKLRRDRERLFGTALFADPAWDMLLDLFVHQVYGRKLSVSSLCVAAYVPTTTALRYIALLEAEGLVMSYRATDDCRKRYVELTPVARDKMRPLLGKAEARADLL